MKMNTKSERIDMIHTFPPWRSGHVKNIDIRPEN